MIYFFFVVGDETHDVPFWWLETTWNWRWPVGRKQPPGSPTI